MNKLQIINRLTKISAQTAWNLECNKMSLDCELPRGIWLSDYIIDKSKYLGIDGGPSAIDLYDYDYNWNVPKLLLEKKSILDALLKFAEAENDIRMRLYERYGKGNIIDVIKEMSQNL